MSGLFPHAVVRATAELGALRGAGGSRLERIVHDGLALVGERAEGLPPTAAPEAFMDAVSDVASATGGACVPMRAVSDVVAPRDAAAFLRAGRERLVRLLDWVSGKEEWSVAVRPFAPETRGGPIGDGGAYLDRRRRELASADGVPASLVDAATGVQRALAPIVAATRCYGAPGGATVAALVETERAEELERLAEERGWALAGPYPAFSFVSLTA